MTFEKLSEYLIDLQNIALEEKSLAGEQARKMLNNESTTHNIGDLVVLVDGYFENRKPKID